MTEKQIQKAVEAAIAKAGQVSNDRISLLITDLEKNLKISFASEIEKITKPLLNRVEALEGKLSIYEAHLNEMESRLENAEQYSRRSCLRIFGVPLPEDGDESAKNCLTKVSLPTTALIARTGVTNPSLYVPFTPLGPSPQLAYIFSVDPFILGSSVLHIIIVGYPWHARKQVCVTSSFFVLFIRAGFSQDC